MEVTFSPCHDMTEDVGNGGKLLGEQDSLVETWTIIGESGLVQLLRNAYKKKTQHQFEDGSSTKIQNGTRTFQYFYKFISYLSQFLASFYMFFFFTNICYFKAFLLQHLIFSPIL